MSDAAVRELSERLVAAARGVRVLDRVSWPRHVVQAFLDTAQRGDISPPSPEPVDRDGLDGVLAELGEIAEVASARGGPEHAFLGATARSYRDAVRMVQAAETPAFGELSRELYGAPDEPGPGGRVTHAELARRVLEMTEPALATTAHEDERICLSAEHVRDAMLPRVDAAFGPGEVRFVIEPDLGSKAAASVSRVRLRSGTCFSEADVDQLLEHEVMVHSATARNGADQPELTALGLGAPRTTATQEGLATFAELITGAMDVSRLRRIALRIFGVQHALAGADFVEVFRFFRDAGQSDDESAFSAARVFRGATTSGDGVAFTKDTVYLAGLFTVHTFFRRCVIDDRLPLIERLFAGRMALGDVLALDEAFEDGRVVPGRVLPRWIADPRRLAAYLAFSAATNPIDLDGVALETLEV